MKGHSSRAWKGSQSTPHVPFPQHCILWALDGGAACMKGSVVLCLFMTAPCLHLLSQRRELCPETPLLGQGSLPDTAVEGLLGSP